MHIGFDGRMITWSGIGTYSRNLLEALACIDSDNQYTIFCYEDDRKLLPQASNFNKRIVSQPVFSLYSQQKWKKEIMETGIDIFHSPHFILPLSVSCRTIVTIHDLIPLVIPQVMPSMVNRQFYRIANKRGLKKAVRIIAVSNATKKDIIRLFNVPANKIKVVYEAASKEFSETAEPSHAEPAFKKNDITLPFVLAIGNPKSHKNWERLIKSFALITNKIPVHKLVLVGPAKPLSATARLHNLIDEYNLGGKVIFVDYVESKYLPAFYNAADVFVFPSLYEGFGLPVVEAMACGTPVITSNVSSLPEVAGEAGLLVDPFNIEELSEAILKVVTDNRLKRSLAKKGIEQVLRFSWEKTAKETLKIYYEIHKSQPRSSK